RSLVISQSADRQERVKTLLNALRRVKTERTEGKGLSRLRIEAAPQGMRFDAPDLQATAQRVSYDEDTGLLVLEGSGECPARLISGRTGQAVEVRALKIICSLKEGKLIVDSVSGAK